MKEDYIATRTYVDPITGEPAAIVPAICSYKKYCEGMNNPHKVAFSWDWDGTELPVGKEIVENVSHATIYDQKGFETIKKVVEKINSQILNNKLAHKGNKTSKEIIAQHNYDVDFAMHVAQKFIKEDIITPDEPIYLFER